VGGRPAYAHDGLRRLRPQAPNAMPRFSGRLHAANHLKKLQGRAISTILFMVSELKNPKKASPSISSKSKPFDKQKNDIAVQKWHKDWADMLAKAKDDPENWADMTV
jgi:hypothetical protein